MGKRKLHELHYFQCDWTGLNMDQGYCYMPAKSGDKVLKRGSYCNWESVLAHAQMQHSTGTIDFEQYTFVRQYVEDIIGTLPCFDEIAAELDPRLLEHFKGGTATGLDYYKATRRLNTAQCEAVRICVDGEVQDVDMEPFKGSYSFGHYLDPRTSVQVRLNHFVKTLPKGKLPKEHELVVYYFDKPPEGTPFLKNKAASTLFKMELFGEVLIVQRKKELCLWERYRHVGFSKAQYMELFGKNKKKRAAPESTEALSATEYKGVKAQMQESLQSYEARAASSSARPQDLPTGGGVSVPPPTGKELAAVARLKGMVPPERMVALEARLVEPAAA